MSAETPLSSDLYHEVHGSGPPILFIAGATGDAGHFGAVAARLADEFTVVTYDRRGNSRSPSLSPGTRMSMAAQARDAACLIEALEIAPAIVFGTSGGGNIALQLAIDHPQVVRAAIVHEPALLAVLPDPQAAMSELAPVLELALHDPRAGADAFLRANTSDQTIDAMEPELHKRLLANGANLFANELEAFVSYVPDAARLAASRVPVRLLVSSDGLDFYAQITPWLHEHLDLQPEYLTGHHAPYLQHPEVFSEELRPLLHAELQDKAAESGVDRSTAQSA